LHPRGERARVFRRRYPQSRPARDSHFRQRYEQAAVGSVVAGQDHFVRHEFLAALERHACVGERYGWLPRHLAVRDSQGQLVGAAPLYRKSNSYGELVFDWSWAEAYQRAGGSYYPKLQAAVPFTPVTGRRLLIDPAATPETRPEIQRTLISGLMQLTEKSGVSSFHMTFIDKSEWEMCGEFGLLQRIDRQFHWINDGYETFDEFLATLTSRKRKAIRRERKAALASGVNISRLSDTAIKDHHWDAFYRFYRDTSDRKWGQAYLNREFGRPFCTGCGRCGKACTADISLTEVLNEIIAEEQVT